MNWQHGYNAEGRYTCGFYRELAPAWLDLAALLKGQPSPRPAGGAPFAYLELGSGMGFGLCLLAACHPEGRFTGIDFQPDHVLHSQRLAERLGLANIRFVEADFLQLAAAPGELAGSHHYVAAHGIATWITAPVRQALLALAATALRPGGLFYCSYNTTPGWLSAMPLQQLAWLESRRRAPTTAGAAASITAAGSTLEALLGSSEQPSALARSLPGLRERLAGLGNKDSAYLVQEYMNEGWQPLPVHALHDAANASKLRYVASATLPDNFGGLLPSAIRDTVNAEADPLMRETLQDLAINQSFRRDVFCRGSNPLNSEELAAAFAGVRLRLLEAPRQDTYSFNTSFGQLTAKASLYQAVEASLAEGPLSFAALQERHQLRLSTLAEVMSLLLHGSRLGIGQGEAGAAASELCRPINQTLLELQCAGRPYACLPAAAIGSAVAFSLPEALLEQAWRLAPDGDPLPALTAGLKRLGRRPTQEPAEILSRWQERRGRLVALGVLELHSTDGGIDQSLGVLRSTEMNQDGTQSGSSESCD